MLIQISYVDGREVEEFIILEMWVAVSLLLKSIVCMFGMSTDVLSESRCEWGSASEWMGVDEQ